MWYFAAYPVNTKLSTFPMQSLHTCAANQVKDNEHKLLIYLSNFRKIIFAINTLRTGDADLRF
jgi:hypothetical protein